MAEIIGNGTIASVVRKSMENRAQLPNKGDIYIGTGNKIDGSDIPDTIGQNIITAINENATDKTIEAKSFFGDTVTAKSGIASMFGDIVVGGAYDQNGVYLKNGSAAAVIVGPSDPQNNSGLIITKKGLYVNNPTNDANVVSIDNSGNIKAAGHISSTKHSIMVVDTDGTTPLAEIDGDGNISSTKHITAANGEITAKTFNARSDKRLKENIVEYSPNKSILYLPIYSYNFISDEKKTKKIGCLAQDLKEICPEIVKEDDKGYLSIEENKIVYLLLDEVKKLKKRVDELEAR